MAYFLIFILILVTIILGKLGTFFGFSAVVGQLLSGIILGASFLNIIQPTHLLQLLAEVGVFLLMFDSGLESDLKVMRRYLKASTYIAIMGVVIPLIIFPLTFLSLGYNVPTAIFSGIIFSATSISITLVVLVEQKKLTTSMGAIIISAAILDDLLALGLVTAFSLLIGGGSIGISGILPLVAFILGVLFRKFKYVQLTNTLVKNVGDWFFYPIFFGSIGLEINIQSISNQLLPVVIFSLLAIVTKFFGAYLGSRFAGLDTNVANAIGAGMISRGEMALVIVQIGLTAKLINLNTSAEIIIAAIISTIVAPIMMKPLFKRVH